MLHIGMLGPSFLLQANEALLHRPQVTVSALREPDQLEQLDGLLLTGWSHAHLARPISRLAPEIYTSARSLSVLGIAAGAAAIAQNGLLPLMDCQAVCRPGRQLTTASLEMPAVLDQRFTGIFLPRITFDRLAPNLGILCQNQQQGAIVLRQGNFLACSYVTELTSQQALYTYWLEMVAALQQSKRFL